MTKIKVIGNTAHASMPEEGDNAMLAMLQLLAKLPLEGE
ncbi:MAG: peptidase dimerization domain-containing protein, partial [Firmicutes bacterium]|nr:peptidase dimerization domain-containing protein [Bacillota bacterium]